MAYYAWRELFFVATKATKKKKNVILCEFASIYA